MISKQQVRYAVVGLGNISQVAMLPAFAHATENSELVALVSGDPRKRMEVAQLYPEVDAVGSYDELETLLGSHRIDAAYLAVPNSRHREMVERIAAMGVHVLCEKPMATTVADCEAMIAAANRRRVKLMIAYRLHFEEATLRTIELVRSGKIGEPRLFSSVFSHKVRMGDIRTRSEMGGGALFDLGTYCLNVARGLFADEPQEVFAWQTASQDPQSEMVDEATSVLLRFPHNRLAQFSVHQGLADVSSYRVVGTMGSIRMEPGFKYAKGLRQVVSSEEGETVTEFPQRDQFGPELLYFSRCILDDAEPEPSGEEGLADVRVLQAAFESARQGAPVRLAPFHCRRYPGIEQLVRRPAVEKTATVRAPSPSIH